MYKVSTPDFFNHFFAASDTNSGPLSLRIYPGQPLRANRYSPSHPSSHITHWRGHAVVVRGAVASLLDMEKRFNRIMGYEQLWMLDAKLKDPPVIDAVDEGVRVA